MFAYVFLLQLLPLEPQARSAAQLGVGVAGAFVASYVARLGRKVRLLLLVPLSAAYLAILLAGYTSDPAVIAAFLGLTALVFSLTWMMRRR